MPAITVLVANHHPIIRNNLRSSLEREPDLRVVGEAADGRETLTLVTYKRPDVVILEMKLEYLSGLPLTKLLTLEKGGAPVIFYAAQTDEDYLSAAFQAGARGYVAAESGLRDLTRAIRIVAAGRSFISPAVSRRLLDRNLVPEREDQQLSEREKEACCLLAAGYDYEQSTSMADGIPESLATSLRERAIPEVILRSMSQNERH